MTEVTATPETGSTTTATEVTGDSSSQVSTNVTDTTGASESTNPNVEGSEVDKSNTDDSTGNTNDSGNKATESYQEFKFPEGMSVDTETLGAFSDAAKSAGLTQEQAQLLVDLGAKNAEKITQAAWDAHNAKITGWAEQSKADKEFGGDNLNENLALASKAIDAFATPELKQLLNETGVGNHPEIIRTFVRIGKQISEDRLVPGGSMPVGDSRSIAERLYPNS